VSKLPILLALAAWASLVLISQAGSQATPQQETQPPPPASGFASGTEIGNGVFEQKCVSCHANPAAGSRIPDVNALRMMAPEKIYAALKTGSMAPVVGNTLTDDVKRRVAETVSGRLLGSTGAGDAKAMPNHCAGNPPLDDPSAGPAWNGWGAGIENTRFQSAKSAGLSADQVPRLKLKWAFGFPAGLSAYGQPTIASGRVFVVSDNGYVYSLDSKTGCVYWSFQANAAMRSAVSVGPVHGHGTTRYAAYFGDLKANVYAVDAQSGSLLWTRRVEDQVTARIAGAPTLFGGLLFVPVSSFEEFAASDPSYPCCTSRGSVVALDADTGDQIWKTYAIAEAPTPVKKNSMGTQLWAPAGGSVWNSPTVDAARKVVYFGTGDGETYPAAPTTDSVIAVDMATGKLLWHFQGTANDSWLGNCDEKLPHRSENCPLHVGADWDFGSSAMLRTLADGHRLLVAGQKSGSVFAFDPDRNGALIWQTSVLAPGDTRPSAFGAIVYGGAADTQNAYFALTDGGMIALELASGKRVWLTPLIANNPAAWGRDRGQTAAVSVVPGAAFVGGNDGRLHGLSTVDGHILWQFDTAQKFTTVNGVAARGGSIGSAGPVIAGGMLFVGSGYGVFSGAQAGNVLLAFSPE
jgi:polyvinyl alcohol dehydrogenase (cytochrome)